MIGRGRKFDYGTTWGPKGTLVAKIYDQPDRGLTARGVRLALLALKRQHVTVYLRNPYGDLWPVGLGNISLTRMPGVGTNEFFVATIPYAEAV